MCRGQQLHPRENPTKRAIVTITISIVASKLKDIQAEMSSSNPRTVEEIFKDFSARRAAIVRALTAGTKFSLFLGLLLDF